MDLCQSTVSSLDRETVALVPVNRRDEMTAVGEVAQRPLEGHLDNDQVVAPDRRIARKPSLKTLTVAINAEEEDISLQNAPRPIQYDRIVLTALPVDPEVEVRIVLVVKQRNLVPPATRNLLPLRTKGRTLVTPGIHALK